MSLLFLRNIFPVSAAVLAVCCWAETIALADDFPDAIDTQELTERLLSPQEALDAIKIPEGFRATLYAAEPDVRQPIALATDDRGRLWVVENYTYAESKVNFETEKQRDRILIFEDTDGNGQFDKRTVFWDQGLKVTSVEIGFDGVWLLAAPNLLFIPDRNRDDVPDGEPEVVLNGWDGGRIRHNIVNGLRWGPDGWLYGRHGIQATSLVGTPETAPEHRTQMECGIWRYHPTRRIFEVVARGTTNPWGMDWDEHGQLFFINTVIGHLWHVVPGSYYQRMYGDHFDPHVYQLLPQNADHYHWDTSQEKWNDIRKGVTSTTDDAGGGHAHQGMMIYAGDNWPEKYRGQLFTFNFHGRRINVDRLARNGATYVGKHADDFLTTSDPWFRGIEMVYGPDGGVIVADWSDIGECHESDGVHRTSGRLFKITHGGIQHEQHDLSKLSAVELVKLLPHRNTWFSRHARRRLQELALKGSDLQEASSSLFAMYDGSPQVSHRLRAMWSLHSIGATDEEWLLKQLDDQNEHIRVWAIKLLVDQGAPSPTTRREFETRAASENSGLVLSYLASSLRRIPHEQRWQLATQLASHQEFDEDSHFPLFVWYGIEPAVAAFPQQAVELAGSSRLQIVRNHIARRLTEEIDRQPQGASALVQLILQSDSEAASQDVLQGMHAAMQGWSKVVAPLGWDKVEAKYSAAGDEDTKQLVRDLSLVFGSGRALNEIRELVSSNETPLDVRRKSIQALVAARADEFAPTLQRLLGTRYINVEAIRGLAAYDHPDTPGLLMEGYSDFHQPARQEAISTLVSRNEYCRKLLSAVADGTIARDEVSPFQIRQMQMFKDNAMDATIDELWPELKAIPEQKQQQIATYRAQLSPDALANANLRNGRGIFKQQCAKCHTLFDDGDIIGPPLTGAQRNNVNYLLENIIDPSATVSKDFQMTIVLTDDGRVLNGVLIDQNDRTITLRTTSERLVLARDEIEQMRDSQLSMMPDSQLDVMQFDQVRDLIAYLMSPSQVPLP